MPLPNKSKSSQSNIVVLFICVIILTENIFKTTANPSLENQNSTDTGLYLSIVATENSNSIFFSSEDLNHNYDGSISYHNISDVIIHQGSNIIKLDEAVRNKIITIDEIIAQIQIDARNGHCAMSSYSNLGLTTFVYRYDDFEINYIHDIYELPSGKDYLIQSFNVCLPGQTRQKKAVYLSTTDKYDYRIDREDWGIAFEILSANPSYITVNCSQFEGQHIGQLKTEIFYIYDANSMTALQTIEGIASSTQYPQIYIQQNSVSQLTINWNNIYGELAPGNYVMSLHILDEYDKSIMHPLMRNYYDKQNYYIEFSIF